MLYKNLPENELKPVMQVRKWLDYLAAFSFFLKGEKESARMVFKARQDFKQMQPSFVSDREQNLQVTLLKNIPERIKGSILWKYYAENKRTFEQLIKKR